MITSYHNHTTWSDGATPIAGQIEGARQAGLDELGISDHYVFNPHGVTTWSMPLDKMADYVADVQQAMAQTTSPVIRLGIEADYFPETIDELRRRLALYPFDYVIGSVHYVDGFPIDEHRRFWDALTPEERVEKWRDYWKRIRELAESRVFDFVAHLDLFKKFGHRPTLDLSAEAHAALDAIATADMAIEINTAGWNLPVKEAYPTLNLLRAARERAIPLLINADAHHPKNLTRDFDRARALAREAGYTQLVRYEMRQRFPIPL